MSVPYGHTFRVPRPRTPENDDSGVPSRRPTDALSAQYALEDTWVIAARGDLDTDTLGPVEEALAEAAGHPVIILDTSGVTFGDSSFLNLLLRAHQSTQLRIVAPPEQLRRLLCVTGADQILNIYGDVSEAIDG